MKFNCCKVLTLAIFVGCSGSIGEPPTDHGSSGRDNVNSLPSDDGPSDEASALQDAQRDAIADLQDRADETADLFFAAEENQLLPRRLWRLTNAQMESAIGQSLKAGVDLSASLIPESFDARYANNVDGLLVNQAETEALERAGTTVFDIAQASLSRDHDCLNSEDATETCAMDALLPVAQTLFRGSVDEEIQDSMRALYGTLRQDFNPLLSAAGTVEYMVQSPHFLYRKEVGHQPRDGRVALSSEEIATALSFFLLDASPEDALLQRASEEDFSNPEVLRAVVRDLMTDGRFLDGLSRFLGQWIGFSALPYANKDPDAFPQFTQEVHAAMVEEVDSFVHYIFAEQRANFIALLTSKNGFHTEQLADIYDNDTAAEDGDGLATRSGLLLLPGVLTALSGGLGTNPMQRANRVLDRMFCVKPQVPAGIPLPEPEADDTPRTTRERFNIHAENQMCATCHKLLDPIAFSMEAYDAIGRIRFEEEGMPIDTSSEIFYLKGEVGAFDNAVQMFDRAALAPDVHACFVRQISEYLLGTRVRGADAFLRDAYVAFVRSGFDIRELIVALTASDLFMYRAAN